MIRDLLIRNRSYRRFNGGHPIRRETLCELVDLTRYGASGANAQSLKFMLLHTKADTDRVFPLLSWARFLKDWGGPAPDERPPAYVVFLGDSRIAKDHRYEAGIAAQTLLLGAVESGLGGCILSSVDRDTLRTLYSVPSELEVLFVVAIGEPVEKVVVEPLAAGSDTRYWRDHDGVHHVPKRLLQDIIVEPHT